MIHTFRTIRTQQQSFLLFSHNNLSSGASRAKFRKVSTVSCKQANQPNMDKSQADDHHKNEKSGDLMSHSFGEGYATRCDDEGFGGIYGRNTTDPEDDPAKTRIHESHPDYDKKQGNEVKEKEKGRNQADTNT